MVLKNFIRFIINKFLNNYIEELNYERLKVDFRHGRIFKPWMNIWYDLKMFFFLVPSRTCLFRTIASQTRSFGSLIFHWEFSWSMMIIDCFRSILVFQWLLLLVILVNDSIFIFKQSNNAFHRPLEKLTLTIPWKHLYTHPTKVSIDGLFMLIVPKNG